MKPQTTLEAIHSQTPRPTTALQLLMIFFSFLVSFNKWKVSQQARNNSPQF